MPVDLCMNQAEMMLLDPGLKDYTKLTDTAKVYQGMKDLRVNRVRMGAIWSYIQPTKTTFNWVDLDRAVICAAQYGLKPHLTLGLVTPNWSPTVADFGDMARAVANRYGPAGMNLVESYEIMNEQNNVGNFSPCTPEHYVPYLKAAYTGIKAVHPAGIVVTGGLMPINDGFFSMSPLKFVQGMYNSGAKGYFDALGNHPYSIDLYFKQIEPTVTGVFQKMDDDIYAVMAANGDGAKQIWWTEIGFAVPPSTLAEQAAWMPEHIDIWLNNKPHVGPCFIYNYRCSGTDTSNTNFNFGIVNYDYSKRPVWAYVNTINAGVYPTLTGSGSLSAKVTNFGALSGSGSLTATFTANIKLPAVLSGSGSLSGALFGRPAAQSSGSGTLTATTVVTVNRAGSLSGSGSLTATADTTLRASPTLTGSGSLTATVARQRLYSYNFDGTGNIKPTTLFTDFGSGYSVSSSKANNNNPSPYVDGYYLSGGIYKLDQASPDHFSECPTAAGAYGGFNLGGFILGASPGLPDRSNVPIVRSNADGSQYVGAFGHWGGGGSSGIFTVDPSNGGVPVVQATSSGAWTSESDVMRLTADGVTYTLLNVRTGTVVVQWVDNTGLFAGVTNRRTGFGVQHIVSNGAAYNGPGLGHTWKGQDVRPSLVVPPAPVPVSATLSGDGALTGTSVMSYKSLASLSGVGALSATLGGGIPALLTGTGALAASVGRTVAASGLTGSGSLTGVGIPCYNVTGSLSGDGLLTGVLGGGPVTYGATGTTGFSTIGSGTTTLATTGSHTAAVGDNLVMADITAAFKTLTSSATVTALTVTYGGLPMTQLTTIYHAATGGSSPNYVRYAVCQFYLENPPSGPQVTAVTGTTSTSVTGTSGISIDTVSYSGASAPTQVWGNRGASTAQAVSTGVAVPVGAMAHCVHKEASNYGYTYSLTQRAKTGNNTNGTWLVGDATGAGVVITSTATAPASGIWAALACIIPTL